MRLFFALQIPEDIREQMRNVQSRLRDAIGREGVRWESPDKFHITVRFLGDVPEERLDAVKRAGSEAASACRPFELEIGDIGSFPEGRQPRVLWVGALNGIPEYVRLDEYLYRALLKEGFKMESRWGKPHITLARAKTPGGGKAIARGVSETTNKNTDKIGVLSVYNLVLCHSELRPEGSVYTVLGTFPLTAI